MIWLVTCAWLFLVSGAGAALAPAPRTSPAQAPGLERVAARVAELWREGDAAGIAELAASGGVRLQLLEHDHLPMHGRRATAALRAFFPLRRGGAVHVARVAEVGGKPRRGFAEIQWTTAVAGALRPERLTVFVGFVLEEERWRVSEIRVLP